MSGRKPQAEGIGDLHFFTFFIHRDSDSDSDSNTIHIDIDLR